jgi:membrane-associated phospholipid phosphatase
MRSFDARPEETSDPDRWREGGDSFPSLHTTAAFAIGTVLAESGNDKYRWTRRCLGYGVVAGHTAYERLDHNAHWLSDTVAGAAIGTATAHFVMNRANGSGRGTALSLVPVEGGVMLTYSATLR